MNKTKRKLLCTAGALLALMILAGCDGPNNGKKGGDSPDNPPGGDPPAMRWTEADISEIDFNSIGGAAYGGSKWVVVGKVRTGTEEGSGNAIYSQIIVTSADDGETWVLQHSETNGNFWRVAYGGGKFVMGGRPLMYSGDGENWQYATNGDGEGEDQPISVDGAGMAYGDDKWVLLYWNGAASSSDGSVWTMAPYGEWLPGTRTLQLIPWLMAAANG